ncbi:MAG: glycosyltransferase [Alphaproteobacteria bacterium]|jgi:glycosyltransferase involved in cell wall biosynthesis
MRAKSTPKVSVLTPIYNTNPKYLRECIESILNQTFTDFEFIILNDSPDNKEIEKIVKSYKDQRIKYYKNEKNIGISASRNKLLDLAQGEYIAVFDHDDISKPTRLEKEVKYLDENPDIGVVSSNIHRFPENTTSNHPTDNLEIKQWLMCAMVVAHTAIMLRKSILDKHNIRYEEEFSPAEDYRLVLRLLEHTMFHNIKEVLVDYRHLEGNTTHLQWDKMCNADALCRDYAARTYPYLYSVQMTSRPSTTTKYWIRLFDLIPIFKVKVKPHKTRYYLFGFIPALAVRR